MSWSLLLVLVIALGLATVAAILRRREVRSMQDKLSTRETLREAGAHEGKLQHPVIDLSRCMGCGTCTAVCPEDGVLELIHGQAVVAFGARCVGIAACERECPVGAIAVTISRLEERTDIPVLSEQLEAIDTQGLYLSGEITARALIKSAVEEGTRVARRVHELRVEQPEPVLAQGGAALASDEGQLDLCIVGAGPAGLACALEARRLGLRFLVLDKEHCIGGTVASYPRRKLVMSEPLALPLHGTLRKTSFYKEELIELWEGLVQEHEIPIAFDAELAAVEREEEGFRLRVKDGRQFEARAVNLAIGRRGIPRKLGVPGEELPKVSASLMEAGAYAGRRVLVVGGGDSAVEAACSLAEQEGTEVTLSYRREAILAIRSKNKVRLDRAVEGGKVRVLYRSHVLEIRDEEVSLAVEEAGGTSSLAIPNDEVFVMIGGTTPFSMLEDAGVSFDRSKMPAPAEVVPQGTGLVRALTIGFALSLVALLFALYHADYYSLPRPSRPTHVKHSLLRPAMGLGLWFGITATAAIALNLLYLLRRSPKNTFRFGNLQTWMTSHIATGILAFLCVLLHAAMAPQSTPGGHAFYLIGALLVTGAIGRYFYAWLPRATNGRELELSELKDALRGLQDGSGDASDFAQEAEQRVSALVQREQWGKGFVRRVLGLLFQRKALRRCLSELEEEAHAHELDASTIAEALSLARRSHRHALAIAHLEDLRGVLASWRYFHRWLSVLMLVLLLVHVVHALVYGASFASGAIR